MLFFGGLQPYIGLWPRVSNAEYLKTLSVLVSSCLLLHHVSTWIIKTGLSNPLNPMFVKIKCGHPELTKAAGGEQLATYEVMR